jgi:hypothetical protein
VERSQAKAKLKKQQEEKGMIKDVPAGDDDDVIGLIGIIYGLYNIKKDQGDF